MAYFSIIIFHHFKGVTFFLVVPGKHRISQHFFRQLDWLVFKGHNLMEINKSKAFFPGSCKSPFFFAIHPPPNTKALILRGFGGGGKGVEIWEPAARLK